MSELTLDQALQKGIEAHKAGKVREADQYYTAILQAQPKHPDANHNMGVLAVGVGKVDQALPFLKTALEANPSIEQFWLSYIDALVKLEQLADAKAVLDQAKNTGVKGDAFDQIENRLGSSEAKNSTTQDPPLDQQQSVINLYSQGKYQQALKQAKTLLQQFPNSSFLYNISGAAYKRLNQLDAAVEAYKKAIAIKPNINKSYWNLFGTAKNINEAKKWIEQCLKVDPNHEKAKLTLSALKFYEGDKSEFRELIKSPVKDHPYMRSFNWVFSLPKLPPLHFHRWAALPCASQAGCTGRLSNPVALWRHGDGDRSQQCRCERSPRNTRNPGSVAALRTGRHAPRQ
mgnify:CR=1 FL=1